MNNGSVRGVVLQDRAGVTLKNAIVELSGGYIIDVGRASNCSLINNTIVGLPTTLNIPGLPPTPSLGPYAINFLQSQGITIKDNYIAGFMVALSLEWSSNHVITGNTITGGITGIDIINSPRCIFRNNNLTNCRFSVRMYPSYSYDNDLDASNTLNGRPIIYWLNATNSTVPLNAGYILLAYCQNIQIINCNPQAINLVATTNSQISNVNLSAKSDGVTLQNCSQITLSDSSFRNLNIALTVSYSNNNMISGNDFTNASSGIMLDNTSSNLIAGNSFADSYSAVFGFQDTTSSGNIYRLNNFTGNDNALRLKGQATVENNLFFNNSIGIYLSAASGSTITQNTFVDNTNDLYFSGSSGSRIYLNNFLHNTNQITDAGSVNPQFSILPPPPLSINQYDNGARGNYWGSYNGSDSNGDGIGDTAYVLYGGNQDNFPLMNIVATAPAFSPSSTPNPTVTQTPTASAQPQDFASAQPSATAKHALPEVPARITLLLAIATAVAVVTLALYRKSKKKPTTNSA